MATPNVGILTNAGKNLIDQVNAGQTKITFSKIVFSSMNNNQLTDEQIKALTTVAPQEIVVNNPEVTLDNNTGETRIRATGNNEALTDGVYVKTYAVYAKDDSGNEILYGITVSPNPNYLPEYDGVTPQVVTYSYKVNISNTSNITFTNSNDVYVSDTDLAEALQPYAKTVDVNQQLDKKVNIADMRKPASDVAGIEEVSTLQTQVDNSAVGTNLILGTSWPFAMWYGALSTVWNADKKRSEISLPTTVSPTEVLPKYPGFSLNVTPGITYTQSIYVSTDAPLTGKAVQVSWFTTTYGHNTNGKDDISSISKNVYRITSTQTWPTSSTDVNIRAFDILNLGLVFDFAKGTFLYFYQPKMELGSHATDWCPNPEDKVNVSDMRKPASDVAGIEEVNAKQDKLTITPADDSKVAHLSGANNFDTVPTVNNNPLLLASSLPSDLARTGQDANFTAKLQQNGQDVALANNTLARNPDTGSVSTANTFTAAQTFSIAPTITDASTDKGDNQAATMADLKSVENSAWHQLNNVPLKGTFLYRIDRSSKRIYISYSSDYGLCISSGTKIADFSSIVNNIKTISGSYFQYDPSTDSLSSVSKLSISSPAYITAGGDSSVYTDMHSSITDEAYFTYDSLK